MTFCTILYNTLVKMYMCRGAYGLGETERGMTDGLTKLYEGKYKVDNTPSDSIVKEF